MQHRPILLVALVDLAAIDLLETADADVFHGQTCCRGAVGDRLFDGAGVMFGLAGQVAHEATGKAVARAGGATT